MGWGREGGDPGDKVNPAPGPKGERWRRGSSGRGKCGGVGEGRGEREEELETKKVNPALACLRCSSHR